MPDLLGLRRQDYPRGTPDGGLFVQPSKTFFTTEAVPDWSTSLSLTVSSTAIQLDQAARLSHD